MALQSQAPDFLPFLLLKLMQWVLLHHLAQKLQDAWIVSVQQLGHVQTAQVVS